jgi:hypothetical protein
MPKSKSIHFFATKRDLEALLSAVESQRRLKYVEAGMFNSPETATLMSGLQIPNLGFAPSGDHNHEPVWLITDRSVNVEGRAIPQRRGGMQYVIDQKVNPQSVTFSGGGVFEKSCVIDGKVGTSTDDATAHELVNLFAREIRRHFTRIKSFFVGREAEQLLDSGYRLTISVNSSKDIDLSRA